MSWKDTLEFRLPDVTACTRTSADNGWTEFSHDRMRRKWKEVDVFVSTRGQGVISIPPTHVFEKIIK